MQKFKTITSLDFFVFSDILTENKDIYPKYNHNCQAEINQQSQ